MTRRPNILILMSDEHRPDVTGYEGNAVVRTPVLDELAATGVVFRNAYTPSPICIPARQCLAAGQLPRTCGCRVYGEDLPPNSMTFARRFAQWAYTTACGGKLHHMGPDQMQGWLLRFAPDTAVSPSFLKGRNEAEFARYTGRDPRWKWLDETEIHRARPETESRNQRFDRNVIQCTQEFIEDYFVDFTYDRATPDRPLLLKVSLLQPHYPYAATRERMRYLFNRVPVFVNEPVFDHPFLAERQVPAEIATEREIRRATAAYYGMVEQVDEHCGSVLQALRDVGQDLDDWIIIYTSDHGEMLGEHGIWEKQKFFEASARVPLIIRWPRRFQPRIVEENVNLCDLFATLCDLAGIDLPESEPGLDSRSLVPLMQGESRGWRNETISQFGHQNLMIKWDALKYQYYGEDMPEVLFDLERDPLERTNFIGNERYVEVLLEFRRRRAALGYGPDAGGSYRDAGYG